MARLSCPHCGRSFKMPTKFASKGGKARAASLTPEQRRDIAQKAAQTRWAKPPSRA